MSTISVALAERLTDGHAGAGGDCMSRRRCSAGPRRPGGRSCSSSPPGHREVIAALPAELFDAIGQRSFVIGEHPPAANVIKLCGNFMIMSVVETLAEAMTLAGRYGVDKAVLLQVLTGTLFGAPIYQTYGQILVDEQFRPAGFAAPLGLKDMNLVSAAAADARVPMPVLSPAARPPACDDRPRRRRHRLVGHRQDRRGGCGCEQTALAIG